MAHDNHHFIPRFFLSAWHSSLDGKLRRMSWINGRFDITPKSAKSAGRELGLYAIRSGAHPNIVEQNFFSDLDNDAALVHQKLLAAKASALSADERATWSRFLVSLMLRTPDKVAELREKGRNSLLDTVERDPEEYEKLRKGTDPATLRAMFEKLLPGLPDDFGVLTLPQIVNSEKLNGAYLGSYWRVIQVPAASTRSFVIGDRPIVYNGTMATSYLVSLPLSPTRMFFSFNHARTGDNLRGIGPVRLVRNLNVAQARRRPRARYWWCCRCR